MAEANSEKKERIGKVTGLGMMTLAIATDGLQAIVALIGIAVIGVVTNSVISAFSLMIFFMWFVILGVNFIKMRRLAIFGITLITEMVPLLNDLPMCTIGIALIISSVNAEDILNGVKKEGFFQRLNPFSRIVNEIV